MSNVLRGTAAAGAVILFAFAFGPAAGAACADPPRAPAMPQGATASDEDMKEGHDALQKYVNILQTYEACVAQQIKNAPPDTKPEVKLQWQANADAAIDAAHQIADVYSIQLRAYKARQ
ncbi:MAG: hypothetical protein JWM91_4666 [Rhodospirillales bacterium]|nr:hypothetical protein [Rhodospirillales bacterium]